MQNLHIRKDKALGQLGPLGRVASPFAASLDSVGGLMESVQTTSILQYSQYVAGARASHFL